MTDGPARGAAGGGDTRRVDRLDRRRFLRAAAAVPGLSSLATGAAGQGAAEEPATRADRLAAMDGAGTAQDPYVVRDVEDLRAIGEEPDASYELESDVDAGDTAEWNGGAGFEPIGEFSGTLDGRGHAISGLAIDRPDANQVGLFAVLSGTVRGLALAEADVTGANDVGALAGTANGATLEGVTVDATVAGSEVVGGIVGRCDVGGGGSETTDCTVECAVEGQRYVGGMLGFVRGTGGASNRVAGCEASGSVAGNRDVGGLVGEADDASDPWGGTAAASIEDCESSVSVSTTGGSPADVGGLVGQLENVPVRNSRATGDVHASGGGNVGGLVGEARDPLGRVSASVATGDVEGTGRVGGLIGHCVHEGADTSYAIGDVTGETYVGGLIGEIGNSDVADVYARGDASGETGVGGIVGRIRRGSSLRRAYAAGELAGDEQVGGVVGVVDGATVEGSYWDAEATGVGSDPTLPDHHGLPTEDLQGGTAVESLPEFDFQTVWATTPEDYPELRARVGGTGGETTGSIEHLRLVQTVEHTRAVDDDALQRRTADDELPVAEALVGEADDPEISWSAPDPDLVADRRAAPAFDLRVDEPAAIAEAVEVEARLVAGGETVHEHTGTLDPAIVAGTSAQRREALESAGVEPPAQLPLLEGLADAPGDSAGALPTLPTAPGTEVEVTVDGPNLAEPATERLAVPSNGPVTSPTLRVGFVGVEGREIDLGQFTFDRDPDLQSYADRVGEYLVETYPVAAVDVVVLEGLAYVRGVLAQYDVARAAEDALFDADWDADADGVYTARHAAGGHRLPDVSVEGLDVGIGVLPRDEYLGEDVNGSVSVANDRPITDVALVELDRVPTAAHELGHYFLGGNAYADADVPATDGGAHAGRSIASTGFRVQGDEFAVLPGRGPLLQNAGSDLWPDAHMYQALLDGEFDAETTSFAGGIAGEIGDSITNLLSARRGLDRLEGEAATGEVDVGTVVDRLDGVADRVRALLEPVDHRWQLPELPNDDLRAELESVGASIQDVGRELQAGDERLVPNPRGGAETTTGTAGQWAERLGDAVSADAQTLSPDAVEWVLRADGSVEDGELSLDVAVVPVLERPSPAEGDGSMVVRGPGGTELASVPAAAELEVVGTGSEPRTVTGVVHGVAPAPATATEVELAVTDEGGERHEASIDPTVDPIRTRVEALPEEAFEDPADREAVLEALERASDRTASGDREAAADALADARRQLEAGLADGYEPEPGEPEPAAVLARVDGQVDRVQGVGETGDGGTDLPREWLVGGGMLASGYYLYRRRDGEGGDAGVSGATGESGGGGESRDVDGVVGDANGAEGDDANEDVAERSDPDVDGPGGGE